jgi:hypothetical protein
MGRRPTVQPDEVVEGSDYQNGIEWMRSPVEEWPVKKTVTPPPVEECRKDMVLAMPRGAATAEVAVVQAVESASWPPYPPRPAPWPS